MTVIKFKLNFFLLTIRILIQNFFFGNENN